MYGWYQQGGNEWYHFTRVYACGGNLYCWDRASQEWWNVGPADWYKDVINWD